MPFRIIEIIRTTERAQEEEVCSAFPGRIKEGFTALKDSRKWRRGPVVWCTWNDKWSVQLQEGIQAGEIKKDRGTLERAGGQILMILV